LNAALKKEYEQAILGNQEAFQCAPFTLDYINLAKNKKTGTVELSVELTLDRTFGGSAFRLASHVSTAPERSQKMGQVALENGIAEILGRFHRITARFPDIKVINVLGSYSTTEAALKTRTTTPHYETRQIVIYEGQKSRLAMVGEWKGGGKATVVEDQDADKTISFVMPAAQIPDTLDNKAISDAVLVAGKISVLKGSHPLPEEFHDAIVEHDFETVTGMLQGIPDLVFSKYEGGLTALDLAAGVNDIRIMKLLLANKADVNAKDDSGIMPLGFAAIGNHRDAAELLLANNADVNAKNNDGMTALHIAAIEGSREVAAFLLARGADISAEDSAGFTPLHTAAFHGQSEMAVLLLNSGANVNAKGRLGSTPLFVALDQKHPEVAEVLRQHGGHK
jgi:hypothetical protein